ncbi:hypothetical protein [Flammeovirga sp. SubArs3]|uniref:hypothetical protein n=1 Tax=Flammeovirga sp. SubArs3 TaxID=2995316 RepID=UPI00248CA02A|nr:hypothetical protein [Flammeovirga sp. SubArs3]
MFTIIANAQIPQPSKTTMTSGAALLGRGNIPLFSNNVWSAVNDASSSVNVKEFGVGLTHQFQFQDISSFALATVIPFSNFSTSFGLVRHGNTDLSEHELHFGIAHKIGIISFGGGVIGYQLGGQSISSLYTYGVNVSVLADLTEKFSLGLSMKNISQSVYKEGVFGADLNSLFILGGQWIPHSTLKIIAAVEQQKFYDLMFKTGLDYQLSSIVSLRGGIQLFPLDLTIGTGVNLSHWSFDYAFITDDVLDWSHQFSLAYHLHHK